MSNLSIIDLGSISIKHYIFSLKDKEYNQVYYKRYSEANLSKDSKNKSLDTSTIMNNINLLKKCLTINEKFKVKKCRLIGTAVFRNTKNSEETINLIKKLIHLNLEIITQEKEAFYLYKGFVPLINNKKEFAAINIGGGSTELIIGSKTELEQIINLPFGVNFLREKFISNKNDWPALITYLQNTKLPKLNNPLYFITGILDYVYEVSPKLGFNFEEISLPRHKIKADVNAYSKFVGKLQKTPIKILRELYPKDPKYSDNVAIGQTVYLEIGKMIGAKELILSNNDLTDGLIVEMIN